LTSALDGGEWSASRSGRFTSKERAPGTHWIGWVDPRAVLDAVVKRKIPSPCRPLFSTTDDHFKSKMIGADPSVVSGTLIGLKLNFNTRYTQQSSVLRCIANLPVAPTVIAILRTELSPFRICRQFSHPLTTKTDKRIIDLYFTFLHTANKTTMLNVSQV
jgi:hypothetical protein